MFVSQNVLLNRSSNRVRPLTLPNNVPRTESPSLKSKFNNRLFVMKLIIFMISSILCIWQLISLWEIFFSYPTTLSMSVEYPTVHQLPAITFCVYLFDYLHQQRVKK